MIIFGPLNAIDYSIKKLVVYNYSGFNEGVLNLNLLPPFNCIAGEEKSFDILYSNYILNNNDVFFNFMKIMMNVYNGNNVYLVTSSILDSVTDSLQKFITSRYGYVCNIINDIEDMETAEDSNFSIQGIYNLDNDIQRFSKLYIQYNGKGKIDAIEKYLSAHEGEDINIRY